MNDDRSSSEVSLLLKAVREGQDGAQNRLYLAVYDELRGMATRRMARERRGHTLQATALVHEAHLRMLAGGGEAWENRAHFFGAAAEAMRRILIDSARSRRRLKRGGKRDRIPLADDLIASPAPSVDLLALDDALKRLAERDARKARVVEYRFFLGLTVKETAELLVLSPRTVDDDWDFARTWLRRELGDDLPLDGTAPDDA